MYCGHAVEGQQTSACLILYNNYEKLGEKKAKKIIQLAGAKIEEPTYTSPVGSHGTSPGSSSSLTDTSCHFLVMEKNEVHEFQCDSADRTVHWLKLLTLLAMFPYSVIPEEPQLNPISESFRAKLNPKLYGAGEWCVVGCGWWSINTETNQLNPPLNVINVPPTPITLLPLSGLVHQILSYSSRNPRTALVTP